MWSVADPDTGGPLSSYSTQQRHGHSWNVSHDWIVTPTMLNRLTFGHNVHGNDNIDRRIGQKWHEKLGIKGVPQGVPEGEVTAPSWTLGASPVMSVSAAWGSPNNNHTKFNAWVLGDNVTWQRGKHTIKFGFEWLRQGVPLTDFSSSGGNFSFEARTTAIPGYSYSSRIGNSFASFMLGEVNSASLGVGDDPAAFRHSFNGFAQDSWKVTPRVTLNIGVRWNADTAITEKNDLLAFDRLISDVMSSEPYRSATRVFWIMDNGSGHRGSKAIRRLQTQWPTIIPVHTPVHASCLNQVEIYFSIIQRKVLTPNDFTSLAELQDRLLRFQQHYQQIAAPFRWTFTRKDLAALQSKIAPAQMEPAA